MLKRTARSLALFLLVFVFWGSPQGSGKDFVPRDISEGDLSADLDQLLKMITNEREASQKSYDSLEYRYTQMCIGKIHAKEASLQDGIRQFHCSVDLSSLRGELKKVFRSCWNNMQFQTKIAGQNLDGLNNRQIDYILGQKFKAAQKNGPAAQRDFREMGVAREALARDLDSVYDRMNQLVQLKCNSKPKQKAE